MSTGTAIRPAARHWAVLGAALLLPLVGAAPVGAHDGAGAAFDGAAGPYRLLAYDGVAAGERTRTEEYAVILTDPRTAQPVDQATVTVNARPGGAAGGRPAPSTAVTADGVGNVYRYALPAAGDATWDLTVTVQGPAGTGQAQLSVHGQPAVARPQPPPNGPPPLLVAAGGMLAAAVVTLPLLWIARRLGRRG